MQGKELLCVCVHKFSSPKHKLLYIMSVCVVHFQLVKSYIISNSFSLSPSLSLSLSLPPSSLSLTPYSSLSKLPNTILYTLLHTLIHSMHMSVCCMYTHSHQWQGGNKDLLLVFSYCQWVCVLRNVSKVYNRLNRADLFSLLSVIATSLTPLRQTDLSGNTKQAHAMHDVRARPFLCMYYSFLYVPVIDKSFGR